jgi:hypothetical protein
MEEVHTGFWIDLAEDRDRIKYYSGHQIKKSEIGGGGGSEEEHTWFWWGDLKERERLEDLDVDGNKKIDVKEIEREGVDRINLAKDKNRCPAVVKTVMNLRVP